MITNQIKKLLLKIDLSFFSNNGPFDKTRLFIHTTTMEAAALGRKERVNPPLPSDTTLHPMESGMGGGSLLQLSGV